jgi:hypothetical protein
MFLGLRPCRSESQVRRSAEAERDATTRYGMLCLLQTSRKGGLEAGATSGRISACLVALSTGKY